MKISKKIITAFILIIVSIFWSIGMNRDMEVFSQNKALPIYSVDTRDKKIALTFDVNWGDDYTEEILNILDKYKIKATFFLVGSWADSYPDKVKLIYSKGHELGNHSDKHPDFTKLSKDRIIKEIAEADAKILNITGYETKLFRCPSGAYNDLAIKTIESTGHYVLQWDVERLDIKVKQNTGRKNLPVWLY